MSSTTIAAVISALVSVVVIAVGIAASRSTLRAARETLDTQLLRNMTVKLYEVRIESYPQGMEITEALRKTQLTADVNLSQARLGEIVTQLDSWYSTKAGFVLSRHSAQRFSALRIALREKPESNGRYSQEQIDGLLRARREFRAALRADILLLFNEDVIDDFLED